MMGVTLSGRLNQDGSPTIRLAESLGATMITVQAVRNLSVGILGISADVLVQVHNPFSFDLHIDGLRYTLGTTKVSLGQGSLKDGRVIVTARGERELVMKHRAAWPLSAMKSPSELRHL